MRVCCALAGLPACLPSCWQLASFGVCRGGDRATCWSRSIFACHRVAINERLHGWKTYICIYKHVVKEMKYFINCASKHFTRNNLRCPPRTCEFIKILFHFNKYIIFYLIRLIYICYMQTFVGIYLWKRRDIIAECLRSSANQYFYIHVYIGTFRIAYQITN